MVSLVLKIIVITFVIEGLGGIGFIVNLEVLEYPKTKRLSLHTRLVLTVTALLIVVGTLIILLLEWSNPATQAPVTRRKVFGLLFSGGDTKDSRL
jgi:trk system potassium uptake protein